MRRKVVIGASAILLVGVASWLCTTMIWDGGFPQGEFQIEFVDASGKPVEGVQLRVEDGKGASSFHYPVSDYSPDNLLASNANGVLTFHHVSRGLEFGGQCTHLFFVIPIGTCDAPVFDCLFVYNCEEVHRARYTDLTPGIYRSDLPRVKRRWKSPEGGPDRIRELDGEIEFRVVRKMVTLQVSRP